MNHGKQDCSDDISLIVVGVGGSLHAGGRCGV